MEIRCPSVSSWNGLYLFCLFFFFFLIRILNYAARDVKNNTLRIYLPVRVIRSWKIVRYFFFILILSLDV